MKLVASIDPCNRVWIEDEENGRYVDDGGFYISFPQYTSKREAKRILALAETMAAAPETARQLEAERALNRLLVEALKAMRDRYVRLADSGDCGFWEPREEGVVQDATAAIAKAEARYGSDEGDPD